jgi:uncharacterized membrane protein
VIELDESVVVARPADAVGALLVRVEDLPTWLPLIRQARLLDPPPAQAGSRVEIAVDGPGGPMTTTGRIVELRPERLAFTTLDGPVALDASCDVEAVDDGHSRLHVHARIRLQGMLRLAEGVVGRRIDEERPAAIAELAARLESAIPA